MTRRLLPLGLVAWLMLGVTPAAAGEPDPGHADLFQHSPGDARITLDWHFGGAYPAWFESSLTSTLESWWQDPVANNSNVPRYDGGGDDAGGGTVIFTAAGTSPCTGDPQWLGCNPAGGVNGFLIYIRSVPSITAPSWLYYQRDDTCQDVRDGDPLPDDGFPTRSCFSVMRVAAHESTHNTLLRPHYDGGAEDETIMRSVTPTASSSPYWSRRNFLPCDAAAAQLEYGPADPAGKYADCFDITPGDGVKGLNTVLTITSGASYTRCLGSAATVAGRLALANVAAYEDMRNWPLSGRVIRIDRKPISSSTWTNGVATATASPSGKDNWSRALTSTTAGTFNYRARWFTNDGEPALNTSNEITWTVQWATLGCPS